MLEDTEQEVDLQAVDAELKALSAEQADLEKRVSLLEEVEDMKDGKEAVNKIETDEGEVRTMTNELETRGMDLKENRAVTLPQTALAVHAGDKINGDFNTISSLADAVNLKNVQGGESYRQPYRTRVGEGDYTLEGAKYHESEPEFAYATMAKNKITDYVEITEEVEKLPNANYATEVSKSVADGIKRKLNREILLGNGDLNQLVGIFSEKADALTGEADIEVEAIDQDTLDQIVFSYGMEDVEGDATLILSKPTLREFARLRTELGTKVYDIVTKGNTGTIDGVPFIINNFAGDVAKVEVGKFFMAYGSLKNYDLVTFSGLDLQRSADFKFDKGIVAYRGSVFAGGNVVAQDGFVRVKKK